VLFRGVVGNACPIRIGGHARLLGFRHIRVMNSPVNLPVATLEQGSKNVKSI
jgi:hypothetical protein